MVKGKDASAGEAPLPQARTLDRFSGDPDFMLSLARGLLVLQAFEREPKLTIGTAAALTGLPRPTARRCLYTLEQLGYLAADAGGWRLRPRLLSLARAYLSSTRFAEAAQPHLDRLRDTLGESCSLGVLDGADVVYVARAETRRIISIALQVGSRLPAYCTSMGRVLLAALEPEARSGFLASAPFPARTPFTRTAAFDIGAELDHVAAQGYAVIDQELELGLRSIAVPVRDPAGRVAAALNVGTAAISTAPDRFVGHFLPALKAAADGLREVASMQP